MKNFGLGPTSRTIDKVLKVHAKLTAPLSDYRDKCEGVHSDRLSKLTGNLAAVSHHSGVLATAKLNNATALQKAGAKEALLSSLSEVRTLTAQWIRELEPHVPYPSIAARLVFNDQPRPQNVSVPALHETLKQGLKVMESTELMPPTQVSTPQTPLLFGKRPA